MALKALMQRKRIDLKKKERDEKRAALDELPPSATRPAGRSSTIPSPTR